MKYLKIFENSSYEKVPFDHEGDRIHTLPISEKEFKFISEIFNPISDDIEYEVIKYQSGSKRKLKYPLYEIYIFTKFSNSIFIYKHDDDYWYIKLPYTSSWDDEDEGDNWVQYKCDQISGIKDFYDNEIFRILGDKSERKKFPNFPWK